MWTEGKLRNIDGTVPANFEEGQQRRIKARPLEIGELIGRRHIGVGIRGASEGEIQEGNPADRPLLDHPGHRAMQPFFQQNSRHIRRDAETEIDAAASLKFLRHATGNHFLDVEFRHLE
ncbi:hypothetical protein D3C78_1308250 [compost metagenome]